MTGLIKNELFKLLYKKKIYISLFIIVFISLIIFSSQYISMKNNERLTKEGTISPLILKTQLIDETSNLKDDLKKAEGDSALKEGLRKKIIYNEYLINHNLLPIESYMITPFSILSLLLQYLGAFFTIIIASIISSDIVSGEFSPPTIRTLLSKPIKRVKILISKFAAAIISSISVIILPEVLVFFVVGLIFGFSGGNYPILLGTRYEVGTLSAGITKNALIPVYGSTYVCSNFSALIDVVIIELVFICACTAFAFLISTLIKTPVASMAISLIASFGLKILSFIPFFNLISPFIFMSYSDTLSLLQGDLTISLGNPNITPLMGFTCCIVWTIVCLLVSLNSFDKKDIII